MTQQEEWRGGGADAQKRATDYAAEDKQRLDGFAEAGNEIWDRLQDANRLWLERLQSEAALTGEFASKLTASRSLSETATLWQDWTAKHVELATEDARRLFTETQKLIDAGTRFWSASSERSRPTEGGRFFS
jgi:hypothetical protein